MLDERILAESKSAEAVQAKAVAAEAEENARMAQLEALIKSNQEETRKMLAEAIRDVFGEQKSSGRFIDVSRIPLICKSIIDIHENIQINTERLQKMDEKLDEKFVTKESFDTRVTPIERVVYGAIALVLTTVVGALLALVIIHR